MKMKEAPEFGNGPYLFINNMNRAVRIFIGGLFLDWGLAILIICTSVACFILACPAAVYRIKKYIIEINTGNPTASATVTLTT